MASRLFHAVVGVGISLGSVSSCGGIALEGEGSLGSPDAGSPDVLEEGGVDAAHPLPERDTGSPDAEVESDGSLDAALPDAAATPDATPLEAAALDAAPDVRQDAIVEAFCDVTWPITKAGRAVCAPAEECEGPDLSCFECEGPVPYCVGPDGQGSCILYPVACVGTDWQCTGGAIPSSSPWAVPTCP
jgi:hypothetical protein